MPSPNLKPCPFCGEKAHLYEWHGDFRSIYIVRCDTPRCIGNHTVSWTHRSEAVAAWNRRAENRKETK